MNLITLEPNSYHEFYLKCSGIHRLDGKVMLSNLVKLQKDESTKELIIFYVCWAFICLIHFLLFPVLKPFIGGRVGYTIDITLVVGVLSMFTIGLISVLRGNILARFYAISWGYY